MVGNNRFSTFYYLSLADITARMQVMQELSYGASSRAKGRPLLHSTSLRYQAHPGAFYTYVPAFGLRDPLECKYALIPTGISVLIYLESAGGRENR